MRDLLDGDVAAYLGRIGVDREPPSVEALATLHRAVVEHVPYETLWIALGERWTVDQKASLRRIARNGRGGYCFHMNGALAVVLEALGYSVSLHVGGVHGRDGPSSDAMRNHLVLLVHGLPSEMNEQGAWYVDAGLGDGLSEPLPLLAGEYLNAGLSMRLDAVEEGGVGDWHLTHDPRGGFGGMSFDASSTEISTFAERNEYLCSAPESSFVRTPTVQLRRPAGADILRGCVLTRLRADSAQQTVVDQEDEWLDLIRDLGLGLHDVGPDARHGLWLRVRAVHDEWTRDQ